MVAAPPMKRVVYALPSDPHSRFIRLILGELRLPFALKNPSPNADGPQDIPTLHDENGTLVSYASCIAEYLDEVYGATLIGDDPFVRAQVRQVWRYVEGPVSEHLIDPLLYERMHRRLSGLGAPDSQALLRANRAKPYFFSELERLIERDAWIASPNVTLADLSLAARLSLLDYAGLIDWHAQPILAQYYRRLKSRPAMRPLLLDRLAGMEPSPTYENLDF